MYCMISLGCTDAVTSLPGQLTFTTNSGNLAAVQLNRQIRQVILGVVQLAKVFAGIKEALEDGESSLAVSLTPFLALGIPHLQGREAGTGHTEIRAEEDVTCIVVHILCPVAVAKNFQDGEFAAQVDTNQLGTAFLIRGTHVSEYGTPSLARLVPGSDGLLCDGADRRVLLVKVENAW